MSILMAAIVAVVFTFMLRQGVNRATVGGRARIQAARDKLAHLRQDMADRPRPGPSSTSAAIGAGAAAMTYGAIAAWDAGSAGFRYGWWRGREWFHDRLAERVRARRPVVPTESDTPEPPPDPPAPTTPPPPTPPVPSSPVAIQPAAAGRPTLTVVPPLTPQPAAGGTAAMPLIETTGEVTSLAEMRRELRATRNSALADLDNGRSDVTRAAAELQDAEADKARAAAEIRRCNHLADVVPTILDRDPGAAAAVAACRDSAAQLLAAAAKRIAAAEQLRAAGTGRVVAAEHHLANVDKAVVALDRHRQMEEAKAATPQASSNTRAYATN